MSEARLGRKASPETRAILRTINSKKRGSYTQNWQEIVTLCNRRGWRFERRRNYWVVFSEMRQRHAFTSAEKCITFLKKGYDYTEIIKELCAETGYQVSQVGAQWAVDDEHGRRIAKYHDPVSILRFLQRMRGWLSQHGRLLPVKKKAPETVSPART